MLYLIEQTNTQFQLKTSLYQTLIVMLEHSAISKHAQDIDYTVDEKAKYSMKDFLGPFLRYLHHVLLASLAEGA